MVRLQRRHVLWIVVCPFRLCDVVMLCAIQCIGAKGDRAVFRESEENYFRGKMNPR